MSRLQKLLLVVIPVLLLCAVPLYDWSWQSVELVIFGITLDCWFNLLLSYLGGRK